MVVLPSEALVDDDVVIDLRDGAAGLRAQVPGRASVSVVVPTLNEVDNVVLILPRIPWWVDEVVLVDGGSTDGTVEAARAVRPDLRVVVDETPGKGAALRTGWRQARGDIVVTIDADGSTDPAEIPAFIGPLLAGADMVKGSRFVHGAGSADIDLLRRLGNHALTRLVRVLYGGRFTDLCYGYNAFWRRVTPAFDATGDGFEIETLMNVRALRHGLNVVEVASFESERIHGQSNLRTFADGWRVLRTILRERLRRPPEIDLAPAPLRLPTTANGSWWS
jgi:glycosyltransferase involved in cell wall biosynthesis